MEKGFIPAQE